MTVNLKRRDTSRTRRVSTTEGAYTEVCNRGEAERNNVMRSIYAFFIERTNSVRRRRGI